MRELFNEIERLACSSLIITIDWRCLIFCPRNTFKCDLMHQQFSHWQSPFNDPHTDFLPVTAIHRNAVLSHSVGGHFNHKERNYRQLKDKLFDFWVSLLNTSRKYTVTKKKSVKKCHRKVARIPEMKCKDQKDLDENQDEAKIKVLARSPSHFSVQTWSHKTLWWFRV